MERRASFTLGHVAIPAPRFEETRAFYLRLGAHEGFIRGSADGHVTLVQMWFGDRFIELIRPEPQETEAAPTGHLALRTADIDAAFGFCEELGFVADDVPRRGQSGVMWFFITDPSGNRVEIVAPITGADP